ncbi:sensor histidine kinase [Breznakiella homolactica]|uniref:Histidine kinase n=1 Tax=Breznakiella homolactica TaxID=2798577 RepID=A0A7T7XR90_9SPIR|nr:histidine kinase [Breznakiella homolactica]QQO11022.1 histidine kinase [Breznakiella homolactica]
MSRIRSSLRFQILVSVFGVFFILVLSTGYILFTTRNLQALSDRSFEQERFISSVMGDLAAYQEPLTEYLATRSSNALARILIDSHNLRTKIPADFPVSRNKIELRERELYSLIHSYLDLADRAIEEKRARNISSYIETYDEMSVLLAYINSEIEIVSTERFRSQLENYGVFIAESGAIQLWNLIFIISVSFFVLMLLFRTVGKFSDPFIRLSAMASQLAAGNFEIEDLEHSSVEEIDRLVQAFNQMKQDIRQYIEEIRLQESIKQEYMQERMRNLKMEGLVRRMEIYTLQAQMNPHFLFNTLNTGMQLAIVEGADRTGEYMEYMAQLFRHIIRNKEIIVPLRHEMEGLNYYFYILKVRFPKNLDLVLDFDETLLDSHKVPVSILQPLVENSIIHGFNDMATGAVVRVRAVKQGDQLVLSVEDNGSGMEAEKAAEMLRPQPIDESSLSRLMGLENVIQRLYFFYPDTPDVVEIITGKGEGTVIRIRIDTGREPCIEF